MELASVVSEMSQGKGLRDGQRRALRALPGRKYLNLKKPTGYGKTFTNALVYTALNRAGEANRLLTLFPSESQLQQFVEDGPAAFERAGLPGPKIVHDLRLFHVEAIKAHRNNRVQLFATTIQALVAKSRGNASKAATVLEGLLDTGRWMVTVDEHHHYGSDKTWGRFVRSIPCVFLLAMSATPYRPDEDGAFGEPDISITYREAVEESVVKPLLGHSYVYRIDAVLEDGEVRPYTTTELVAEVGSDSPEVIERHLIARRMRWSPKYVSPLLSNPIERMLRERLRCGFKLQALIGAMSVSHARMVCDQVRSMYPELKTDWVGTGTNGRTDDENAKVLKLFCPPKNDRGERHPELDILVHVGMAGEGLDSTHVSEVVHLNAAEVNNSNNQENGRASRYLPGVMGNINFDSSSGYARAGYVGDKIMDAMDSQPPGEGSEPPPPDTAGRFTELPEEPVIQVLNVELEHIDSGDPEVVTYKRWLIEEGNKLIGTSFTAADLSDPASPIHDLAVKGYRNMRRCEAQQHNEQSRVGQWKEAVANALSAVTGTIIRTMYNLNGEQRIERSIAGDIKRRINGKKKHLLGELTPSEEVCRKHYAFLVSLDREVRNNGEVPSWLR